MSVPLRDYGAVLIADPGLSEDGLTQLKNQFTEMVTRHGGKVVNVTALGKKRLAYRIGKHHDGNYLQIKMQLPPAGVDGLTKLSHTLERVIRLMILSGEAMPEPVAAAPKAEEPGANSSR